MHDLPAAAMQLFEVVLHIDRYLTVLTAQYHTAVYALLFLIIFAETGLVVTPFLPGDSLLFATGALAAVDSSHTLTVPFIWALLAFAAVLGNTANYALGRALGPRAFTGRVRLLSASHLRRTEEFFRRYGAMTIVVSRFMPIVRTVAPFVAGIGRMAFVRFQAYNVAGALAWTALFIWGGYLFGNVPAVKAHFGLVTIAIIAISLLPAGWAAVRARSAAAQSRP
ncbi:MAG: VTT domain-containing protein [Steroidobacteraceae bacterium]